MKPFFFHISTLILSFLIFSQLNAQKVIHLNDKKFSFGLRGFEDDIGIVSNFDYEVNELFSLGIGADLSFKNKINFCLLGRSNFHLGKMLNFKSNIDLYPGLDFEFRCYDGFSLNSRLGFSYLFSKKLGTFIEIGNHGAIGILLIL